MSEVQPAMQPAPVQRGDTAATSQATVVSDGANVVSAEVTTKLPAKTPDITPAQVAAGLKFVVMVLLALGLHINSTDQVTIIGASGFICTAIILADAFIRRGRANALSVLGARSVQDALAYKQPTQDGGAQA